jgi:hypothetical protein
MGKVTTFLGNMVCLFSKAYVDYTSKYCEKFDLGVGFWRTYYGEIKMIYLPPEIKMVFYRIQECIIGLLFIKKNKYKYVY